MKLRVLLVCGGTILVALGIAGAVFLQKAYIIPSIVFALVASCVLAVIAHVYRMRCLIEILLVSPFVVGGVGGSILLLKNGEFFIGSVGLLICAWLTTLPWASPKQNQGGALNAKNPI